DGLNDLQALNKAYVSFAIRGSFESTLQVSDIYAPKKDLNAILEIINLAKTIQQTVKANLLFAIFYNTVGGLFALAGFINPLVAAILMPISSFVITSHTVWRTK
ncbi:MAG: heavy metal translocating P-type ATPase, partial [Pseudobdellovibrio sp.]